MVAFFTGWALWLQMTFVLINCLVITIALGWLRNWYTWRRDKRYIELYGPAGGQRQDIEARADAEITSDVATEVPFGVRALQMGVQVEGVWISRPNTPAATSPRSLLAQSKPTSAGASQSSMTSILPFSSFLHLDESVQIDQVNIPPSTPPSHFNQPAPLSEHKSDLSPYSGTEKVSLGHYETSPEVLDATIEPRRKRHKSASGISFLRISETVQENDKEEVGDVDDEHNHSVNIPSIRCETPVSDGRSFRTANTYLSQSNHRLSHVAETGQLGVRTRQPRQLKSIGDPSTPTHNQVSAYRPTITTYHQPRPSTANAIRTYKPPIIPSSPLSSLPTLVTPTSQSYAWSPASSSSQSNSTSSLYRSQPQLQSQLQSQSKSPSHSYSRRYLQPQIQASSISLPSFLSDGPSQELDSWPLVYQPTTSQDLNTSKNQAPMKFTINLESSTLAKDNRNSRAITPSKYPELDIDIDIEFLSKDPPNLDLNFVPEFSTYKRRYPLHSSSDELSSSDDESHVDNTKSTTISTLMANPSITTNTTPGFETPIPSGNHNYSLASYTSPANLNDNISLDLPTTFDNGYRKVNENFEVRKGNRGLLTPLELPQINLSPLAGKSERPASRKLKKKRPVLRSHSRSKSVSMVESDLSRRDAVV